MQTGIWKKLLAAGMAVTMLFTAFGCGKEEKKDAKEMVYSETDFKIEGMEEVEGKLDSYVVKDKRVYFTTSEWIEEGVLKEGKSIDGRPLIRLYSANLNGKDLEEIPFPELEKGEDIREFTVNDKNEIFYLKEFVDGRKTEYAIGR